MDDNKTYVCSDCGKVVEIEQDIYDMHDFDGKCEECFYTK